MAEEPQQDSLRGRLGARGEELVGKVAQDLLENPLVNSVLSAALDARGRAAQAQEVTMEFLNLPSAAQIDRLTRRVRALGQRLESLEDSLSRVEDSLRASARVDGLEQRLDRIAALLEELRERQPETGAAVSRDQERLRVEDLERSGPEPLGGG